MGNYIPLYVKGIGEGEAPQQAQEHIWTLLALRQQEMKTASEHGRALSRPATTLMRLAKGRRRLYIKREPRLLLAGRNRGWHGAVCAPVHGYQT